jgi:Flp pilus assembly protein TadG
MCDRPEVTQGDRGSLSLFVVFFTIGVLLLAGLLVDLGNAMNAKERAADVAEQAARAAADTLNLQDLRSGVVSIDRTGLSCARAQQVISAYAAGTGIKATMSGTCQYPAIAKVTVSVNVSTTATFAGFPTFTMTATESACAETAVGEGC